MPGDDNSGVFVGFPDTGANTDQTSISQGEEIQIDATDNPAQTTGAIYLEQAPDAAARDAALNPPGEWNEYELVVREDRIRVYLNGVKINEWIDDDPNVDLVTGRIGLQTHGAGDDVYFRNVRIRDLDALRRCIGAAFAEMEMRVALAEILRRRTVRAASGNAERVARRNVTFSPAGGTRVIAVTRQTFSL